MLLAAGLALEEEGFAKTVWSFARELIPLSGA